MNPKPDDDSRQIEEQGASIQDRTSGPVTRNQAIAAVAAIMLAIAAGVLVVSLFTESPDSIQILGTDTSSAQIAALEFQTAEMRRSEDRLLMAVVSMIGIAAAATAAYGPAGTTSDRNL